MNNDELQIKKYVITYLDVLGTTTRMNDSSSLSKMNELLNGASFYSSVKCPDVEIVTFSDNIVVAEEFGDTNKSQSKSVRDILSFSKALQQVASWGNTGWLIRGGITIGDLCIDRSHNKQLIWGKALVEAYKLEEEVAIYPRIIVDPMIVYFCSHSAERDLLFMGIDLDEDGQYFLNYVFNENDIAKRHTMCEWYQNGFDLMIEEARIIGADKEIAKKTEQKLRWHQSYVNRKYDEYEYDHKLHLRWPENR